MAAYEERADECQAGQSVLPENIFRSFAFSAFAFPCFFTPVQIPFFYPVHHDDQYKECKEVTGNSDDISHEEIHAAEDRKSTRLNSSHVAISYAVFCLK